MELRNIPIDLISESDLNVRRDLSAGTEDASLEDLAASIRDIGLQSPILVCPSGDRYQAVARRRFLACRQLGLPGIPAQVRDFDGPVDALSASLTENFHRADMNPVDQAEAFSRLHDLLGSYPEVAKRVCLTERTVRRYAVLMNLAPTIRARFGTPSEGSAGSDGAGVLTELASRFKADDQEEALQAVEGLKSSAKTRILRESGGDLDAIPGIKANVMEESGIEVCHDGLCPMLSNEVQDAVRQAAVAAPEIGLTEFRQRFG